MATNSKRGREKRRAKVVLRPGTKSVVLGLRDPSLPISLQSSPVCVKQGHEVFVVMTQDATEFISPLTSDTAKKSGDDGFFDEEN
jgi:hypothetical protein